METKNDIKVFASNIDDSIDEQLRSIPSVQLVEDAAAADVWFVVGREGLEQATYANVRSRTVLAVDSVSYLDDVGFQVAAVVCIRDDAGVFECAIKAAAAEDYYRSPTINALIRLLPSPEELRLLRLVIQYPNDSQVELAGRMGLKPTAVKNHFKALYRRAGVGTQTGLILAAVRLRWIDPSEFGLDGADSDACITLTPGEMELLRTICRWPDATEEELASVLPVEKSTVSFRMHTLRSRAGVNKREAMIVEALRLGWVKPEECQGIEFAMEH